MAADARPLTPLFPDAPVPDAESFVRDLASISARPPEGASPSTDEAYCSFCWTAMPASAQECGECGRTVAEMDASRAALAALDGAWEPGGRETPPPAAPEVPEPEPVPAAPTDEWSAELAPASEWGPSSAVELPSPPTIMDAVPLAAARAGRATARGLHFLVVSAGAVALVVGAGVGGQWLAQKSFAARPVPVLAVQLPSRTPAPAPAAVPVKWPATISELKLQLLTPAGKSAAGPGRSVDRIAPGEYVLRVTESTGLWAGVEERVSVTAGRVATIRPAPASVGAYYLWRGKSKYEAGDPAGAEASWREAAKVDPAGAEAHLQLAGLLAVSGRRDEARAELDLVLRRTPGDERALALRAGLGD